MKNKSITRLSLISIIIAITCLLSCNSSHSAIKGNTTISEKSISIEDYIQVKITGSGNIYYTQVKDVSKPHLTVEIDENLFENLDIYVSNKTLHVGLKDGYNINLTKFNIKTSSNELTGISIAGSGEFVASDEVNTNKLYLKIVGSGSITFDKLSAGNTNVSISGSGDVNLNGESNSALFSIAGSGNINAKYLVTESADCKIAGSGDIKVNAKEKLNNKIAGSGDIEYVGNPTNIENNIAGSGKVKKIN